MSLIEPVEQPRRIVYGYSLEILGFPVHTGHSCQWSALE